VALDQVPKSPTGSPKTPLPPPGVFIITGNCLLPLKLSSLTNCFLQLKLVKAFLSQLFITAGSPRLYSFLIARILIVFLIQNNNTEYSPGTHFSPLLLAFLHSSDTCSSSRFVASSSFDKFRSSSPCPAAHIIF
jgi:hypothetical protein